MKKIFACFFVIFLVTFCGRINAQNCIPDYIWFNLQSEVDSFQYHYPGCTHILGDVRISGNAITNLNGLSALTAVNGDLEISNLLNLTSLQGLDNLLYVGGDLIIDGNYEITNLTGLQNLETVEGGVYIVYNYVLTSISALSGLEGGIIEDLSIHHNGMLEDCGIAGICDYLSSPNGHVKICYNAPGCDNPPDVDEQCGFPM